MLRPNDAAITSKVTSPAVCVSAAPSPLAAQALKLFAAYETAFFFLHFVKALSYIDAY